MSKTCAWCHKPTEIFDVFAPDIPILDWMEEKIIDYCKKNNINKELLWGDKSNWENLELDEEIEAELLVYDELIETISRKTICEECLKEDDKLWRKYYNVDDFDEEFEFDINDLN
jgi:hypothetical protein|tara:strand:+ start:417 stop:761 length:345 start_codon:yes stop_codon:yes gene_type:complete